VTEGNGASPAKDLLASVEADMRDAKKARRNGRDTIVLPAQYDKRYDDISNAERFLDIFGDEVKYLSEARKWLVWDGERWKQDKEEAVFKLAMVFAKDLYSPEFAFSDEAKKHAQRTNTHSKLNAFLSIAQKSRTVPAESLDAHPYLINCRNGTLDLRTCELRSHDRDLLITKIVACDYDPDARRERVDRFLARIQPDPAIRAFLQRSIGYSLLGTVRERAFWILYGIGNNGKSIFLNILSKILGDYASGTSASSIMSGSKSSIPNDIARLRGQRFVVIPETEENERLNASLVKALSAGDTVTARFLFGEFFDFSFSGKLWIATNHRPAITDHSKGMWDRLKLVPFTQDIPAEEVVKSDDLIAELMEEKEGFFAWAVQGCRDYFEVDGLDTPPVIQAEIDAYRLDQDIFLQFIKECCEEGDYFTVYKARLYERFRKFAVNEGYIKPPSHSKLSRRLKELGYTDGRDHSGQFWCGLRVIEI
jgi:putative DNA primase/helicase